MWDKRTFLGCCAISSLLKGGRLSMCFAIAHTLWFLVNLVRNQFYNLYWVQFNTLTLMLPHFFSCFPFHIFQLLTQAFKSFIFSLILLTVYKINHKKDIWNTEWTPAITKYNEEKHTKWCFISFLKSHSRHFRNA